MEFKVRRSQAGEGAREWSRVSGSEPGIIKFCNVSLGFILVGSFDQFDVHVDTRDGQQSK